MDLTFFVTVPRGMESLLAGELKALGAGHVTQGRSGASFKGSLETGYRVCLWSRLATRVLLRLAEGPAADADELYATVQSVDWSRHLGVDGTLAVDFTGSNEALRDTRFGAVRVKDAIVDQFRASHGGARPSVDARHPDLRVNAHLIRRHVAVSLDLSGDSLHRRGYRTDKVQVEAPLKENLAAAMLVFAAWPKEAAAGGSFVDPLCGSGTLPVEAAMMAADVAPGLLRAEAPGGFGLLRWRAHDGAIWARLVEEARERRAAGLSRFAAAPGPRILGSDADPRAVRVARACVARAGLEGVVTIEAGRLLDLRAPGAHGLLAANVPYGERLGERAEAEALTRLLGERLREAFPGWHAAVLAGSREQAEAAGLPLSRHTTLYNGPIACTLGYYAVGAVSPSAAPRDARAVARSSSRHTSGATGETAGRGAAQGAVPAPGAGPGTAPPAGASPSASAQNPEPSAPAGATRTRPAGMLGGGAEQLANRLHKNLRRLGREIRREGLTCYRLYDADLPEYNIVVDVYGDWVHVQEYAAPAEIDPGKTRRRLQDALSVIGAVLGVPGEHIVLKERRRQRGTAQYERRRPGDRAGSFLTVDEDDLTYLVNLHDYLDTGLFLDQRPTRRLVRTLAGGRRFLNLFAYTGTMTVNAVTGGSPASTTVDLSSTYLQWAQRNLETNGFKASLERSRMEPAARPAPTAAQPTARGQRDEEAGHAPAAHRLVQADCLSWIAEAEGEYDLIWLDPPTFSNSKRMGRATFDVQRDHADLLRMTARRLLAPGGILLFSTNRRGFKLAHGDLGGLAVKDLSRATLPFDCARSANRHHVFRLERGADARRQSGGAGRHGGEARR